MSIPADHMARLQDEASAEKPAEVVANAASDETSELRTALAEVQESNKQLLARVEQSERVAVAAAGRQDATPAEPQPEPEWDKMTTKQIVEVVIEAMQDEVGKVRQELGTAIIAGRLEVQIEKAMGKYPDFMEYSQDVVKITQEKDGKITPEEAYVLAKKRREDSNPKAETDGKPKVVTGARPATRGVPKPEVKATNAREAANKAFHKVFGRQGAS
jgi:ketosteroid isomerase-like protein